MNEWPPNEDSHGHKKAVEANFGSEQKEVSVVSSAGETEQEILDRKAGEAERIEDIQQDLTSQEERTSTDGGKTIDESEGKEVINPKKPENKEHSTHKEHGEEKISRMTLKGFGIGLFLVFFGGIKAGWDKVTGKNGGGGGGHSAPKKSSAGHGGGHH